MLADVNTTPGDNPPSWPSSGFRAGSWIYFWASSGKEGTALYRTLGFGSATLVKRLKPGPGAGTNPANFGALGSTRTQAKRLHRLEELGFTREQLGRIHGPIGLKLGGRAPAEIAIAILAEATLVLHRAEAAEAEAAGVG